MPLFDDSGWKDPANIQRDEWPFPELIVGKEENWRVSIGDTGFQGNRGRLSYGGSRVDKDHALGHVKWNPKEPIEEYCNENKLFLEVLGLTEDIRINHSLKELDFLHEGTCYPQSDSAALIAAGIIGGGKEINPKALDPSICKYPTKMKPKKGGSWTAEKLISDVSEIIKPLMKPYVSFETSVEVAKELQKYYEPPFAFAEYEVPAPPPKWEFDEVLRGWGELYGIRKPALSRSIQVKMSGLKPRAIDHGVGRIDLSRLLTDQRVFQEKRKKKVGTVLIDSSGSMSMTVELLEELMDKMPYATIAMYSGDGTGGFVTILAKNGVAAGKIPPFPGGNCIDGPALKWLSQQEKPLLWYSDGGVTGVNDGAGHNLAVWCAHFIKRKRITRLLPFTGGDSAHGIIPSIPVETWLKRDPNRFK